MSLLKAEGGIGFFAFIYVLSLRGDTKFDRIAEKQIFRWSEVAGGRLGNLRWNLLLMLFFHREARRLRYFNTYRKEKKLLYECRLYTGSEPFADVLLIPYCVCSLNQVFAKLVNAQVAVLQRFSYTLEKLVCFQASPKGCNVYVCALTPQACSQCRCCTWLCEVEHYICQTKFTASCQETCVIQGENYFKILVVKFLSQRSRYCQYKKVAFLLTVFKYFLSYG